MGRGSGFSLVAFALLFSGVSTAQPYRYMLFLAHNPGKNGTVWRSDLSVLNVSSLDAAITLTFRPPAGDVIRTQQLPVNAAVQWSDAVASLFDVAGDAAGALLVESNARLIITHYSYSQLGAGSVGQTYPAVTVDDALERGRDGFLAGLRNTGDFRSNFGVINISDVDADVTIALSDAAGSPLGSTSVVSVPAGRWVQVNDVFGASHAGAATFAFARLQVHNTGARVWAYASVIENHTGDPATISLTIP